MSSMRRLGIVVYGLPIRQQDDFECLDLPQARVVGDEGARAAHNGRRQMDCVWGGYSVARAYIRHGFHYGYIRIQQRQAWKARQDIAVAQEQIGIVGLFDTGENFTQCQCRGHALAHARFQQMKDDLRSCAIVRVTLERIDENDGVQRDLLLLAAAARARLIAPDLFRWEWLLLRDARRGGAAWAAAGNMPTIRDWRWCL